MRAYTTPLKYLNQMTSAWAYLVFFSAFHFDFFKFDLHIVLASRRKETVNNLSERRLRYVLLLL